MIVPRTRLLVCFAVVVLPLATLTSTHPRGAGLALLGLAFFAVVVALDAWDARHVLDDVSLLLPTLVRWQKNREGTLATRIRNGSQARRTVRIGLLFPDEIAATTDDVMAELPAGVEFSLLNWTGVPARRGQYLLETYCLETTSKLRLWAWRQRRSARCEVRVYPNFLDERKHVAALFLNRGHGGIHSYRQAGKGRDFEKLRDYVAGDSFDDVHWKASAKRGRPVTKIFQIERTQEVYVILDASRLMARDPATFERYLTAGLLLAVAAEQQGDLFGMIAFSDRVLNFTRARSGKAQFDACRDMFYALQPQSVTPDFEELASFLRTRLRKRSLLVFLTALDDPVIAESFQHAIELVSRQHLILVNMIQPGLARPLFSHGDVKTTDEIYRQLGGHLLWNDLREMGKILQRRGVRFTLLEQETLSASLVSQYMNVKAMQLI